MHGFIQQPGKKAHQPNKERFLCIEREEQHQEKTRSEQTQTFDSDCLTVCYVSHMDYVAADLFSCISQQKVKFSVLVISF